MLALGALLLLPGLGGHPLVDPTEARHAAVAREMAREGHTEAVQVEFERDATLDQVREALLRFGRDFCSRGLPSAPENLIVLHDDPFRPQPRLDR
ncbi:MAG: aspartate-semialdehyde dehydrogenase, partial [Alphaproteobacteria bacterium]